MNREVERQCAPVFQSGPLCVFNSRTGDGKNGIPTDLPSQSVYWTNYYRSNPRSPENVQDLAPWVIKRLELFVREE